MILYSKQKMSNHKCRSIIYECTKLTSNSDIFPDEMKIIMENITNLKKVPLMHLVVVSLTGIAHWSSRTILNIDIDWDIPLILFGVIVGYPGITVILFDLNFYLYTRRFKQIHSNRFD